MEEDTELQIFLNWAAQLGVSDSPLPSSSSCLGHSLAVSHFPDAGGRGLMAVRNLRKGELILRVPKSLLLTRDNVMNGDRILSFALRNHPSLTSTQVDVAIWTAERAAAEAECDWKGALTLMEEIELKPRLRTLGAWLWASATISSRTLHIPWDEAGCLCPVGDLFNYAAPGDEPKLRTSLSPPLDDSATDEDVPDKLHDDQSDTHTNRLTDGGFNDADAAYCFYARENYKKGEQVLLGYGLYTNLELLEHYGFLLSNNPNDRVFIELERNMNYTIHHGQRICFTLSQAGSHHLPCYLLCEFGQLRRANVNQ